MIVLVNFYIFIFYFINRLNCTKFCYDNLYDLSKHRILEFKFNNYFNLFIICKNENKKYVLILMNIINF